MTNSEAEDVTASIKVTPSPVMDVPCDWQMTKQKGAQRVEHILETGQWADCKFIVGHGAHQQIVKGHKLILAISSPVFGAMFFGELAETNNPISIEDAKPEVFKAMMQYIYTDHVNPGSIELAYELCYCGKKYMLPFLVEGCIEFISSNLSPEKVCRAYEFANLFEKPVLTEKCLEIIRTKTKKIFSNPNFEEIELGTLVTIFEQEELEVTSEIELFLAVERWARFECMRKGIDHGNSESMRSVIGNALTKIRFLTLTLQEFAEGPAGSLLLEESEALAILRNISSGEQNWPMPEGFCTNLQRRVNSRVQNTLAIKKNITETSGTNGTNDVLGQVLQKIVVNKDTLKVALAEGGLVKEGLGYCFHRFALERIHFQKPKVLVCSETFKVSGNSICVNGLLVPSQIGKHSFSYTEALTITFFDPNGGNERLIKSMNFTPEVNTGTLIKLIFDEAIHVRKNEMYRIEVTFKKAGCYPILPCRQRTTCHSVLLSFGVGYEAQSIRGDLVASIIFTPTVGA